MKSLAAPLVISLLLVALFIFPTIQQAHASGPGIIQTGGTQWPAVCTSTCTNVPFSVGAGCPCTVQIGDALVVIANGFPGHNPCDNSVSSFSDSLGTSFTLIQSSCIAGAGSGYMFVEYGVATSSGTDTFSITISGTTPANDLSLTPIDIRGQTSTYLSVGIGNCNGCANTAAITPDFILLPSSYLAITEVSNSGNACNTPQGGFTKFNGYDGAANTCVDVGSGIQPSITSPTNFPWTVVSSGSWVDFGMAFALIPSTSTVVPCTAFQLQCWLYPMFVFGVYMILIVGTARLLDVPRRDYTGHLLEGFSLAGMVCVIFGILNVFIPLAITVLQVVRALRE